MHYRISKAQPIIEDRTIRLAGSKSISNRVLIIRALAQSDFPIHALANAQDTQLLRELLASPAKVRDAGPAGTTFRFLTAYLAMQSGIQILTGSERMKQRPIGILVDALRTLGARIDYLEKEGFPPLRIGDPDRFGRVNHLAIPASTSSQYISALLMIAPVLPNGLSLELVGSIVSRPYIEMTLGLMQAFGIAYRWEGNRIDIDHQAYQTLAAFTIEADWSAASYYYATLALADSGAIALQGLFPNSLQGDSIIAELMRKFGIETTFLPGLQSIRLTKSPTVSYPKTFEHDFLRCPDLAQTLAVVCAGTGVQGRFSGLQTLRIKETDRIAALQAELSKVGVNMKEDQGRPGHFLIRGKAVMQEPMFETYDDHRMAMAFAPLGLRAPVRITDPGVVGKSYPDFWTDLRKIGFDIAPQ